MGTAACLGGWGHPRGWGTQSWAQSSTRVLRAAGVTERGRVTSYGDVVERGQEKSRASVDAGYGRAAVQRVRRRGRSAGSVAGCVASQCFGPVRARA